MSDEGGYDRLTNPERYRRLHEAADDLIAELGRRYDVTVEQVEPEGEDFDVVSARRVTPSNAGAPVIVMLTAFPGIAVRFGHWHVEGFPRCGCDACDEQPDDLVEDLRSKLQCLADGRFSESPDSYEFSYADGGYESGTSRRSTARESYEPWPRRA